MHSVLLIDPDLPWHQYTHLEILDEEFTTPTDWLRKVLTKNTSIETLVLYPCQWEEPPDPLVHESLRTLEFRPNVKNKAYQILDLSWLTFAALERLVLVDVDLERVMDSVIQIVEQSYCQLRSISVYGIMLSGVAVARFSRAAGANAVNLTLEGQLFDHLFDHIASDETFLPKLEELVIRLDKHIVLSPPIDALAAMIRRFGMLLRSAMFKDHWLPGLVDLRENLPVLDEIFTIIENCSPELYEDPDRQYILRLATLRYALERFVREADRLPTEYNLTERAERLLDDKFGWNPNRRKRSPAEMKARVVTSDSADG